ncbi:MAG: hypothetical protein JNK48_28890 [Bryobacterales bacterium]|nr:hypothetical protein [Bryobacterales bacterium]
MGSGFSSYWQGRTLQAPSRRRFFAPLYLLLSLHWQCACKSESGRFRMASVVHEVEVAALYRNSDEGQKAAAALRESGCEEVDIFPVTEKTIPLLHAKERGRLRRFCLTSAAIPSGFLAGGICASPIALIFGVGFTVPIAVVAGIAGSVLATDYVRRLPARQPEAHEGEGVIVRAECPRDRKAGVVELFQKTHADDISIDEFDEADFIYQ